MGLLRSALFLLARHLESTLSWSCRWSENSIGFHLGSNLVLECQEGRRNLVRNLDLLGSSQSLFVVDLKWGLMNHLQPLGRSSVMYSFDRSRSHMVYQNY
uniref:Uncharacterized protein n=1 Tax=Cacopsylla melanoneura TaxID=428564 RepID=A0A8D8RIE2_9HEMI